MKYKVFFLLLIWLGVLLYVAIDKIITSGLEDYFNYFTNWSWSIQIIFYYLLGVAVLLEGALFKFCCEYLLLPVTGITLLIYVVVMVLVLINPNFILEHIGEYSAGMVFFGNALFHYVPPFILVLFIFICSKKIKSALRENEKPRDYRDYLYQVYSPLIVVSFYRICNDYREVYRIKLNDIIMIVLVLLPLVILSGSIYFVLFDNKKNKNKII